MNDNTLIENAILAFLHNYPDHHWVNDYKVLLDKVITLKNNEQSKNNPVQERGRPEEKQGTQKTASSKVSKTKSQNVKIKTTT